MFDISVVIPTRNRPVMLGHCLMSLCEQSLDPARFEICVVNNGQEDSVVKVVNLIAAHYPKHRIFYVNESQTGVAYARNAGTRHTQAPLIVQGDDDATMPCDWLQKYLNGFAALGPKIGKIGGDIIPVWEAPKPAWITDDMLPLLSAAGGFGNEPRYVDTGLLEGNGCYRREALETAGLFPVSLGHKGQSLLSAENAVDLVMYMSGWQLYFDPSIVIYHHIHKDRLNPEWFRRRYFWQGVSDYAVITFLKTKGFQHSCNVAVEMPLDRANWTFVNNSGELPTLQMLNRLRSLGFVLASSGFIPL